MNAFFGRLIHCRRGVSAVEFAMVVPVMLGVVFGGITYAGVLNVFISQQHAAAELARAVTAGLDQADRRAIFTAESERVAEAFRARECATFDLSEAESSFVVTVRYDYTVAACRPTPRVFWTPVPDVLTARSVVLRTLGSDLRT